MEPRPGQNCSLAGLACWEQGVVGRAREWDGTALTLSSAFLATQHLVTPRSTCTCPRRFPISVMMLMAESYLGTAVCTAEEVNQAGPAQCPLPSQ